MTNFIPMVSFLPTATVIYCLLKSNDEFYFLKLEEKICKIDDMPSLCPHAVFFDKIEKEPSINL